MKTTLPAEPQPLQSQRWTSRRWFPDPFHYQLALWKFCWDGWKHHLEDSVAHSGPTQTTKTFPNITKTRVPRLLFPGSWKLPIFGSLHLRFSVSKFQLIRQRPWHGGRKQKRISYRRHHQIPGCSQTDYLRIGECQRSFGKEKPKSSNYSAEKSCSFGLRGPGESLEHSRAFGPAGCQLKQRCLETGKKKPGAIKLPILFRSNVWSFAGISPY